SNRSVVTGCAPEVAAERWPVINWLDGAIPIVQAIQREALVEAQQARHAELGISWLSVSGFTVDRGRGGDRTLGCEQLSNPARVTGVAFAGEALGEHQLPGPIGGRGPVVPKM